MTGGCSEFPDNHFLIQFPLIEDVANMLRYGLLALAEQFGHMRLSQPDRFIFKPDIDGNLPIGCLINYKFRVVHGFTPKACQYGPNPASTTSAIRKRNGS